MINYQIHRRSSCMNRLFIHFFTASDLTDLIIILFDIAL